MIYPFFSLRSGSKWAFLAKNMMIIAEGRIELHCPTIATFFVSVRYVGFFYGDPSRMIPLHQTETGHSERPIATVFSPSTVTTCSPMFLHHRMSAGPSLSESTALLCRLIQSVALAHFLVRPVDASFIKGVAAAGRSNGNRHER
jgi:hypothetical protein